MNQSITVSYRYLPYLISFFTFLLLVASLPKCLAEPVDAKALVLDAMNHWRGVTSYSEMTLIIHRPDWERRMTTVGWTEGTEKSLLRVVEPKKDAGNGTLLDGDNMWTFSPKINRIVKIPSSMMNQSWMGSDFSNKDISKSTDIVDQYDHKLLNVEEQKGHKIYTIESIPHEEAAVVWGKEVLKIRDDYVLLEEQYWDQDGGLVKTMQALKVEALGGRPMATIMRMSKKNVPDEWTEMRMNHAEFDVSLPKSTFTLSNLRNPRQ